MISKDMKCFVLENKKYRFDSASFNVYFKKHTKRLNTTITEFEEILAEKLFVTQSAVHNWRFASNGPGSLELIEKIAELLSISDYKLLLKTVVEVNKMADYSTLKIESIKRIYDAIVDFLDDFYKTDGFTGELWYEFARKGSRNPELDINGYAEDKIRYIESVLRKEYFYLHDTEVYGELCEYVDNDLWETFDGKTSYAYRFEAGAEGNPTTEEDYNKALKRINEIIEKYV